MSQSIEILKKSLLTFILYSNIVVTFIVSYRNSVSNEFYYGIGWHGLEPSRGSTGYSYNTSLLSVMQGGQPCCKNLENFL